jgi:hypothetical protein
MQMYRAFSVGLSLCSDVDIIQCDADVAQNLQATTFSGTVIWHADVHSS